MGPNPHYPWVLWSLLLCPVIRTPAPPQTFTLSTSTHPSHTIPGCSGPCLKDCPPPPEPGGQCKIASSSDAHNVLDPLTVVRSEALLAVVAPAGVVVQTPERERYLDMTHHFNSIPGAPWLLVLLRVLVTIISYLSLQRSKVNV